MIKLKSLITEDPDKLSLQNGIDLYYDTSDAMCFGIFKGKMLMEPKTKHWQLIGGEEWPREYYEYPGRLWYKHKIITFWEYPENKNALQTIMIMINRVAREKGYNFKIDKDWQIEILADKDGKWAKGMKNREFYNLFKTRCKYQSLLIPIVNYTYSAENKRKNTTTHTLSPVLKFLSKLDPVERDTFYQNLDMISNKDLYTPGSKAFQLALSRH